MSSSDSVFRQLAIVFIDLTAGSVGGAAAVLVGLPLDTVKVKMQTFPDLYPDPIYCVKRTITRDGFRGLYAGLAPAMTAAVADFSITFCAYGVCNNAVCHLTNRQSILNSAIAGSMSAFFSSLALCPTELIKCKLQALREAGVRTNIGSIGLVKQIVTEEGLLGMYRGIGPTFAREIPGYFVFFGTYEWAKKVLRRKDQHPDEDLGILKTSIAGGFAGMSLWASIYPIDMAKSKIQVQPKAEKMIPVIVGIYQRKGFKGLYKGLTPTLVRCFFSNAALFVGVEKTKTFLNNALDSTF